MLQFRADNIDQLDLALDQLAVGDRNFDRFAIMLIDNVAELTLHQLAADKAREDQAWKRQDVTESEQRLLAKALGQNFSDKAKFALGTGLIDEPTCNSLRYLHSFRNTAYHQGLRHESVLHSLAVFYFRIVCTILQAQSLTSWSWSTTDKISHRAQKYLGDPNSAKKAEIFVAAYQRLDEVAASIGENLVEDLADDMSDTIEHMDEMIDFLANDSPEPRTRDAVVIESQAWSIAFTEEGREFAKQNGYKEGSVAGYVDWIAERYPWTTKADPIAAWRKRQKALAGETNYHNALARYCEFMRQTRSFRSTIDDSAASLDMHIQMQIDEMRGK